MTSAWRRTLRPGPLARLLWVVLLMVCARLPALAVTPVLSTAPPQDSADLRLGARLFAGQCLACHGLGGLRWRALEGLGMTAPQVQSLLPPGKTLDSPISAALTPEQVQKALGAAPTDLSWLAQAQSQPWGMGVNAGKSGTDYIYTYLRSFYRNEGRPSGWDNAVIPDVAMPNILAAQQGAGTMTLIETTPLPEHRGQAAWQQTTRVYDANGSVTTHGEPVTRGAAEATRVAHFQPQDAAHQAGFDRDTAALAGFLAWAADPSTRLRHRLGPWVLLFLTTFLVVAWLLQNSYWKSLRRER